MPIYSGIEIPAEVVERSNAKLLRAPKPQYLYADLWKASQGVSLGGMPTELGEFSRPGAPGVPDMDRDRLMLASPIATSVVATPMNNFAGQPGDTMRFNRQIYTGTTYTIASRQIKSGQAISTTGIVPKVGQTKLTIIRLAGPYDSANSRVAPYALDRFDVKFLLHAASDVVFDQLQEDFDHFLHAANVALLDTAASTVWSPGMTADNDATSAGMFPFTWQMLIDAERVADEAHMPTFPDGMRVAVLAPMQVAQLGQDPNYARASKEQSGQLNQLFPTYVTSVGKTHIFKNSVLTTTANSSSVNVHTGHYFGPDVLMGGTAGEPARIAFATENNFGETIKPIWLFYGALGIADNTLALKLKSAA